MEMLPEKHDDPPTTLRRRRRQRLKLAQLVVH